MSTATTNEGINQRKNRWTTEIFGEKPAFNQTEYAGGVFILSFFFHDQTNEAYPYKKRIFDKASEAMLSKENIAFTVTRWTSLGEVDFSHSTKSGKVLEVRWVDDNEDVLELLLASSCPDFPDFPV